MRDLSLYKENARVKASSTLEEHAQLVKQVAMHLITRLPANIELDDLIQVGMIGLLEADQTFDPSRGAQFETFARFRIRGAMIDEVRRTSNLPRSVMSNIRETTKARGELEQRLGRAAYDSEMADYMGVSLEDYHANSSKSHQYQTVSLTDSESGSESELRFEGLSISKQLADGQFRSALATAIGELSEREQLIFSLYYNDEMNLKEIALILGVTESRVCQIQRQAIKKLQTLLAEHID